MARRPISVEIDPQQTSGPLGLPPFDFTFGHKTGVGCRKDAPRVFAIEPQVFVRHSRTRWRVESHEKIKGGIDG